MHSPALIALWSDMKKLNVVLIASSLTWIVGCSNSEAPPASPATTPIPKAEPAQAKPVIPAWDVSITDKASLVERLPQDVLMYARIPNLWGVLNAPKKNSLHSALSSKANQSSTQKLQQGSASLVDNKFGPLAPIIKLLSSNLRSPLELAVRAGQAGNPMSVHQSRPLITLCSNSRRCTRLHNGSNPLTRKHRGKSWWGQLPCVSPLMP